MPNLPSMRFARRPLINTGGGGQNLRFAPRAGFPARGRVDRNPFRAA